MSYCIRPEDVIGQPGGESATTGLIDENLLDRDNMPQGKAAFVGTQRLKMIRQVYEPGGTHFPHDHPATEQAYYIIEGSARVRVGKEWFDVEEGTVFYLPPKVEHELFNNGDGRLVNLLICVDLEDEPG
jgi:quercetin dioxygenase-like cupin family protein